MGRYAKSLDESRPHRVGIAKAAIEGDGLERPFTCFEHPARGIDARAFDELVRRDPASMSASDRACLRRISPSTRNGGTLFIEVR